MDRHLACSAKAPQASFGIVARARQHFLLLTLAIFFAGMIAGCDGKHMVGPGFHGKLSVTPETPIILAVGDTQRIVITGTSNNRVVDLQWLWSSRDSQVATVDSTGLVTGRGSGKASIIAESRKYGTLVSIPVTVQ